MPSAVLVGGDLVTFVGSGFADGITGNSVALHPYDDDDNAVYDCTVVFGNRTTLEWIVPNNAPAGRYNWGLSVSTGGSGILDGSVSSEWNVVSVGISVGSALPTSASACGGAWIALSGSGYPWAGNTVR